MFDVNIHQRIPNKPKIAKLLQKVPFQNQHNLTTAFRVTFIFEARCTQKAAINGNFIYYQSRSQPSNEEAKSLNKILKRATIFKAL